MKCRGKQKQREKEPGRRAISSHSGLEAEHRDVDWPIPGELICITRVALVIFTFFSPLCQGHPSPRFPVPIVPLLPLSALPPSSLLSRLLSKSTTLTCQSRYPNYSQSIPQRCSTRSPHLPPHQHHRRQAQGWRQRGFRWWWWGRWVWCCEIR